MASQDTVQIIVKGDTSQFRNEMKQSNTAVRNFGQDAKKLLALTGVATGAVAAAAAVRKFTSDSIKDFVRFEESTAEVFTLMPDLTQEAMAGMREDVKDFSKEVGRTTDEVVPALYQAISAGVPRENVFDFLDQAHQAALGGVTDLETAIDGITSVVNAYGVEVVDATEASDAMFTAVRLGKTTFGELSASLNNVTPLAAALGVSIDDVTAALAAMTAQGTPTAQATVQMRGLLQELGQEGTIAADVFEQAAGVSFAAFIAQGHNMAEAMGVIEQAAIDTGTPVQDLFGNVRAGLGALQLTGQGAQRFSDNIEEMGNKMGATAQAAETMQDTAARSLEELKAAVEVLRIEIGEKLLPTVVDFANFFVDSLDLMASTSEWNRLRSQLLEAGASWADINAIVDDGRAKVDLYRTAADMERDLAANERGIQRMELALQGLNAGLTFSTEETINYTGNVQELRRAQQSGTDQLLRYVEAGNLSAETQEEIARWSDIAAAADYRFSAAAARAAYAAGEQAQANSDLAATGTDVVDETEATTAALEAQDEATQNLIDSTREMVGDFSKVPANFASLTEHTIAMRLEQAEAERQADALAEAVERQAERIARSGDAFMEAIEGTGFFNQELATLGDSMVYVSGLSGDEQQLLSALQAEYNSVAKTVRDYQIGVADLYATDEERNTQIAEGTAKMAELEARMAPLVAVTGQYVQSSSAVTVNQDAVNQALLDAVDAADGSAEELAILGAALGVYSEEAATAALQSALIQQKIDRLAQSYLDGSKSIGAIQTELQAFIENVQNVELPIGTAAEKVGEYSETIGNIPESAGTAIEDNVADRLPELREYSEGMIRLRDDAPYTTDLETNATTVLDDELTPYERKMLDMVEAGPYVTDLETNAENVRVELLEPAHEAALAIANDSEYPADLSTNAYAVRQQFQNVTDTLSAMPATKTITITTIYRTEGAPPERQHGGPVQRDRAYLVGEEGAELFVPNEPGYIYPNSRVNTLISQGGQYANLAPAAAHGGDTLVVQVDARGSTDEAAVERAAQRGVEQALRKLGKDVRLARGR